MIIDGGAKPISADLPDSFYIAVAALATAEDDPPPFAIADDFARNALKASDG